MKNLLINSKHYRRADANVVYLNIGALLEKMVDGYEAAINYVINNENTSNK